MVKKTFVLFLLLIPFSSQGQTEKVVINEIAWMGTPVAGIEEKQWWRYEWLELYNPELQGVSLDGWTLVLYKGEDPYFSVPLRGSIATQGYFLVGASDKIPGVDVNYSNLGGKFLNTGQKVVLSNASGQVVDEVDATAGWPAGDNKTKQTMERVGQGWQTSKESGGTPKIPNSAGAARIDPSSTRSSYPHLNQVKEETEKDLSGSLSSDPKLSFTKDTQEPQPFQSRVSIVNPITLLAGFLALGFSGVLLLVRRFLASRQERQQMEHPERNRGT